MQYGQGKHKSVLGMHQKKQDNATSEFDDDHTNCKLKFKRVKGTCILVSWTGRGFAICYFQYQMQQSIFLTTQRRQDNLANIYEDYIANLCPNLPAYESNGHQRVLVDTTCQGDTYMSKSLEVYLKPELTARQLTAHETHEEFVSYWFTQISILSCWGWWDNFSLDCATCVWTLHTSFECCPVHHQNLVRDSVHMASCPFGKGHVPIKMHFILIK